MRQFGLIYCCLTALLFASSKVLAAEPALQPWPENPWYWSYQGEPVLLLGDSDDDNLFQGPEPNLVAQLDRLAVAGGNVIRNTMPQTQFGRGFPSNARSRTRDSW